jgi:Ca2+-binding EF-hand superfamily protein
LFNLEFPAKKWQVVIKNMDFNKDGSIQYTEFLVAACKKNLLFNNENLLATFQYFDQDHDGRITSRDLATAFSIDLKDLPQTLIGKSYTELLQAESEE